ILALINKFVFLLVSPIVLQRIPIKCYSQYFVIICIKSRLIFGFWHPISVGPKEISRYYLILLYIFTSGTQGSLPLCGIPLIFRISGHPILRIVMPLTFFSFHPYPLRGIPFTIHTKHFIMPSIILYPSFL